MGMGTGGLQRGAGGRGDGARCPAGLPQGAAHPGDLGERAGRHLRALLPEHRPGGGLHAGGMPRGGSG